eukprot:SAG31_NODE_7208_length_1755_cov_1.413647_3_plen_89_part_00
MAIVILVTLVGPLNCMVWQLLEYQLGRQGVISLAESIAETVHLYCLFCGAIVDSSSTKDFNQAVAKAVKLLHCRPRYIFVVFARSASD